MIQLLFGFIVGLFVKRVIIDPLGDNVVAWNDGYSPGECYCD